jgi:hypothetical protein
MNAKYLVRFQLNYEFVIKVDLVFLLMALISPSMSKRKGSWPKLASMTSPGVCSPTVGYRFAGRSAPNKSQFVNRKKNKFYCSNK